jgi:hypothetical protein
MEQRADLTMTAKNKTLMEVFAMEMDRDRANLYRQECRAESEESTRFKMSQTFCEKYAEFKKAQPVTVKRFKTGQVLKGCYVWSIHVCVKYGKADFSYQVFKKGNTGRDREVHLIEADEIIAVGYVSAK